MLDFNQSANTKLDAVEAVPMPPHGNYVWRVTKLPTTREFSGNDGTNYQSVEFPVQVVRALDDVDISDYKGKITDVRQTLSFMYNRDDEVAFAQFQNRLKRFLSKHLKCCEETDSFAVGLNASVGQQFMAPLNIAPDKRDPEVLRANIGNTAPLD